MKFQDSYTLGFFPNMAKGIWNFANMEFKTDAPGVIVENIHLGDSLMKLCYEVKNSGAESGKDE